MVVPLGNKCVSNVKLEEDMIGFVFETSPLGQGKECRVPASFGIYEL